MDTLHPLAWLAQRCGRQLAEEFQTEFGGDDHYIPKRKQKDLLQEFLQTYDPRTISEAQIAKKFGVTKRTVYNRLSGKRKSLTGQTSLFQ